MPPMEPPMTAAHVPIPSEVRKGDLDGDLIPDGDDRES